MLNQQTGFLLKSFVWNIKSGPQKKSVQHDLRRSYADEQDLEPNTSACPALRHAVSRSLLLHSTGEDKQLAQPVERPGDTQGTKICSFFHQI